MQAVRATKRANTIKEGDGLSGIDGLGIKISTSGLISRLPTVNH